MAPEGRRSRKRGVRASREKLYRALIASGLKTQAALAGRIADLEGLDEAPKDVVNRVFRELPVELGTMERVALALGVEAHRLYKTADEPGALRNDHSPSLVVSAEGAAPATRDSVPELSRAWRLWASALAAVIVLTTATVYWWTLQSDPGPEPGVEERTLRQDRATLDLGPPKLIVLPFAGDQSSALTTALRGNLAEYFSVASPTADMLAGGMEPAAAASRLRTDVAISGEIVTVGRFKGIRVYQFARGVRQQIWAESAPAAALNARIADMAARAAAAVRYANGMPVPDPARPGHFPLAPVQDDYLHGRQLLDRPSNELNVRRAQARFESALRQDANYALAHAGLCAALLDQYWLEDAQRALADASRACGRALQLVDATYAQAVYAHFLLLTGRIDESVETYGKALERDPANATALAGLAGTYLHAFRQDHDHDKLALAMRFAREAADADPAIWKPLFSLAAMNYFAGDPQGAIAISEEALERDRNEYVLANLGTYHFCSGDLERARDAYTAAHEVAPQSYVGAEFLGMLHYFLGDYEQSAELRRVAIGMIASAEVPEIHEMWGNLADSYRRIGDATAAMEAYRTAAEIAERDVLLGTATMGDRASRVYYYTMLASLAPESVSPENRLLIEAELEEVQDAELDPAPAIRLALALLHGNDVARAEVAFNRAAATCHGYGSHPDLAGLRPGTSQTQDRCRIGAGASISK